MMAPMSDELSHDDLLDRYADLALHVGVGLRPGQRVLLRTDIAAAPLARRIVAAAYRAGAPYVDVRYGDEQVDLARFRHAPDGSFEALPTGRTEAYVAMAERGDAVISLGAGDPELLAEVDPERVATARAANGRAMKPFSRHVMSDRVPWTVLAVPTPAWAAKVFPDDPPERALERLWQAVFQATRVDRDDPVGAWNSHVEALEDRARQLNESRYAALRFRGPGTDLTVGLADDHVWKGGASHAASGQRFVANLPTEEVFTAPHANRVAGTVRAAMPLAYGGRLIEGFELDFEDGRVVAARAEGGEEVLTRLLDTDEGARRLGEVALVSVDSPIHRTGLLFYNTLFDENAASHVALGEAYRFCVEGGPSMSDEEAAAHGLNESAMHVDFMIGTPESDVDGVRADGGSEPLIRAGRFEI